MIAASSGGVVAVAGGVIVGVAVTIEGVGEN